MAPEKKYALDDIKEILYKEKFPCSGLTELGSARFNFSKAAPIAGTAVHAGSLIREELQDALAVSKADRFREEDPATELFMKGLPIQVIALDSRFEYDVNRSEEKAIPLTPDMAWGLKVWKRDLTAAEKEVTLNKYHEFHSLMEIISDYLTSIAGKAYIFDMHSYCYQRDERLPWYENGKPEINLGTEAINKEVFGQEICMLLEQFNQINVEGRKIRAAENEVFRGGYLARKLCARHYNKLAVFAVEFKKIFMDEWSGEIYTPVINELRNQISDILSEFTGRS
jgi:N-formylglutamate deformylase